jgi:hypothetical protein
MRDLIVQIKEALQNPNLCYISLFASLTIPDICGAMSSDNGEASKQKYIDWYNRYVANACHFFTGEDCYNFRCSFLHQGSTQHPKSNYTRIIFVEPSATTNIFHCNILNDALNFDIRIFCSDMIHGAEKWLKEYENTPLYQENYNKFVRRYPDGLKPYIGGLSVIS